MLSDWLAQGQPYGQFWDLTPREIVAILRGGVARVTVENDLARQRNYELATLIAYAFNDPKNMPKFSAVSQKKEVPDEVAQAQVRGFFIAMSKKAGG